MRRKLDFKTLGDLRTLNSKIFSRDTHVYMYVSSAQKESSISHPNCQRYCDREVTKGY